MDQLDLIRDKINIVELIGESVPLKKAGRNFKGLCPFHNEKTPSFVVSPERQIWHCFGCGKGGDIFTFLMELDHLEFPEALKILAERVGVKLERRVDTSGKAELKERLLSLHHLSSEYYHYLLTSHRIGERARLYLKERGMSDALIKTFALGFAPESWDNLTRFLRKKGFSDKELELSGLVLRGRSGWYDRFRGRVMFPLKNYRAQVIAFAGRVLIPDIKEAKYVNSPETPLYSKGETLYGLEITKEAIRKAGSAVVVEGEFDLISSFQAGVPNVVAIKGTALTEGQVRLLKRFTERLVLALDQDSAGDAAARRGIEIAEKQGMDIRVIKVPSGKDPDEAARNSAQIWKQAVTQAQPFYDYLIDSAFLRFGTRDAFGKKKISDELLPILAKIDNAIVQTHYVQKLAAKLGVSETTIFEAMKKIHLPTTFKSQAPQAPAKQHVELVEEHLLALVLQFHDIASALTMVSEMIDPSDLQIIVVKKIFIALIDFQSTHEHFAINDFAQTLAPELLHALNTAYLEDLSSLTHDETLTLELTRALTESKRLILRRKIKELTTQITKENTDGQGLTQLQQELSEATRALKALN